MFDSECSGKHESRFYKQFLKFKIITVPKKANLDFKTLDQDEFAKIGEECKKTFNINLELDVTKPNELQMANDTSNEPHNVQCFLHCIVSKSFPGKLYYNGSFIVEQLGFDPNAKVRVYLY